MNVLHSLFNWLIADPTHILVVVLLVIVAFFVVGFFKVMFMFAHK
ncbi:MAG TPA: hypothetical protein V6C81_31830 [Planktothrix sp.]